MIYRLKFMWGRMDKTRLYSIVNLLVSSQSGHFHIYLHAYQVYIDVVVSGHPWQPLNLLSHAHVRYVAPSHGTHGARHSGELSHGRVRGVHLRVAAHGHTVHAVGSRVAVWAAGAGVHIPHHAITAGDYSRGEGLSQLLLLLPVFGPTVLEPHLRKTEKKSIKQRRPIC